MVRAIYKDDGMSFVSALDVCDAMGMPNPEVAVSSLDEIESEWVDFQGESVLMVNEFGVYKLAANDNFFKKWMLEKIFPEIRKNGAKVRSDREETITVNQMFHLLTDVGVELSLTGFWSYLKTHGYVVKNRLRFDYELPSRRSLNFGHMRVTDNDSRRGLVKRFGITKFGQEHLLKRLVREFGIDEKVCGRKKQTV